MSFKDKAYLMIGLFCFVFNSAISQDQRMADSLIAVYNSESFEGDELDILVRIVQEETNPDKNLEFSELLISRAAALDSTHYLYQGYLQKGNALHLKGNNSEALESYFKSLELANTNKDERGMGSVLISIADTYSVMDNSKNAELYYSRGIEALRRLNDSVKIATALLNAGDYYIRSGKQDTALAYTTESLDIFQRINYPLGQAYSMGNLGMIYAESQSDDLAERNINEAIFILEDLEDYYPITVYLTYMSDIYSRRDNHSAALSYAQRSLEMASLYGLKDQISEANLKLSELYQAAGDLSASYDHYKDHIVYRDSVMNIDNIQKMADLRTDFEVSQKQIEVDLAEQRSRNQRNISIATAIGLIMFLLMAIGLYRRNRFIRRTKRIIEIEKERSDNLLLNILPEETAQELKQEGKVKARKYEAVTVLFSDFKGFTSYSENLSPEALVETVDFYFSRFDAIVKKHGLEKIKTIGDAYMCAGGLRDDNEDHAMRMVLAATEIVEFVEQTKNDISAAQMTFDIRIGINTGPVVAGVVGTDKFAYDIWGDTVNVASRMESNSEPGKINISENTYELVKDEFRCTYRGEIEAKNRGGLKMYFVDSVL